MTSLPPSARPAPPVAGGGARACCATYAGGRGGGGGGLGLRGGGLLLDHATEAAERLTARLWGAPTGEMTQ